MKFKFARTRVWMYYVSRISPLPPPFNLFPVGKIALGIRRLVTRCSSMGEVSSKEQQRYKHLHKIWMFVSRLVNQMSQE